MRLFTYIVAYDYGFAPNPFFGFCTLATCKPGIRRSAAVGDWVVGTGAKTKYALDGHLIYAMLVSEIVTFDTYWSEPRFRCKRPIPNGSLKQIYGDNIYHRRGKRWIQEDSHHSLECGRPNERNIARDTGITDRVLIGEKFVYFGEAARRIPASFRLFKRTGEDLCCSARGYSVRSHELAVAFAAWLESRDRWGLQGLPLEFAGHRRQT